MKVLSLLAIVLFVSVNAFAQDGAATGGTTTPTAGEQKPAHEGKMKKKTHSHKKKKAAEGAGN